MNFVIYSKGTGRVRRILIDATAKAVSLHQGEDVLEVADKDFGDLHALQALVNARTGKAPSGDRYVVIDERNKIVGAVLADPACGDALPNKGLVKHARADKDWTYEPITGAFIEPIVEVGPVMDMAP